VPLARSTATRNTILCAHCLIRITPQPGGRGRGWSFEADGRSVQTNETRQMRLAGSAWLVRMKRAAIE